MQTSHARLKGEVPLDRESNSLCALAGGKLLVLYGGVSRNGTTTGHDAVGREVGVLNLETMLWDKPGSARTLMPTHSHTVTVVGRTKLLVFGGVRAEAASPDVTLLNTDTMKWQQPQIKGSERPPARSGHATCAIREKVFVFGGAAADGATLLNDLWIYDQDSLTWTYVTCFGNIPAPRRGASLCATEDGRRLYLFGGSDGAHALNDVYFLELEKLAWCALPVHVSAGGLVSDFILWGAGACWGRCWPEVTTVCYGHRACWAASWGRAGVLLQIPEGLCWRRLQKRRDRVLAQHAVRCKHVAQLGLSAAFSRELRTHTAVPVPLPVSSPSSPPQLRTQPTQTKPTNAITQLNPTNSMTLTNLKTYRWAHPQSRVRTTRPPSCPSTSSCRVAARRAAASGWGMCRCGLWGWAV